MNQAQCDVLIVGGGMAGASLAIALSGLGLKITVIESVAAHQASQPSFDDRGIALAYGSSVIFKSLGVWEGIRPHAEPIHHIHISDKGHFGAARMDRSETGTDALGYVALAKDMGHALLDKVKTLDDVEWIAPAQVLRLAQDENGVTLEVDREGMMETWSASVVAACDGGQSKLRESLGIGVEEWAYDQTAVITNISTSRPHAQVAFERFTDTGPLAVLPMTEGRCSVVWTTHTQDVESLMGMSDANFTEALEQRFGLRLGRITKVGSRQAYPLKMLKAERNTEGRVALVGNASHTIHPVAGQGFNLGLRDVAVLAEKIAAAHQQGQDLGAANVLDAYAQDRDPDHKRVIALTDGLARGFSNPLCAVAFGRNLGLIATDLMPGLKRGLMKQTMGLAGKRSVLGMGSPLQVMESRYDAV